MSGCNRGTRLAERSERPEVRLRRLRRRLPCHHLPAFRPFSPHVGVAAVEQLGLALDDGVYPDVAGHHHGVVAVDLDVLDRALDLEILEHALLAERDVFGAGVGLRGRMGVDQLVAQQPIEGVEVAVDHRLITAVFELLDLGLDRGVAHDRLRERWRMGALSTLAPPSANHGQTMLASLPLADARRMMTPTRTLPGRMI